MGTRDAFHPCSLYDDDWLDDVADEWGGRKWRRMRWLAGGGDWGRATDPDRVVMLPNTVRHEVYNYFWRLCYTFACDNQVRLLLGDGFHMN